MCSCARDDYACAFAVRSPLQDRTAIMKAQQHVVQMKRAVQPDYQLPPEFMVVQGMRAPRDA
jgi:hypothetical protein